METSGGKLTTNEKTQIESLEKDLKAVKKAREALGDAAPKFGAGHAFRDRDGESQGRGGFSGRGGRGGGVLGKRRRDDGDESSEEETPEDVKRIPMPRDTPPPIPKEILDKWYQKRRERMGHTQDNQNRNGPPRGTSANMIPLGAGERMTGRGDSMSERPSFTQPKVEAKTTYESAPVIRDLRKEATAFVPAAVRAKLDKSKGVGGLVEPEEMDKLEKAGYMGARKPEENSRQDDGGPDSRVVMMEEVDDEDG